MPAFFLNFGQNPMDLRQIPTNVTKVKRSRSAAVFWLHCYFWSICPHWWFSGNKHNWGPHCQFQIQCPVYAYNLNWSMFSHVRPPKKHTGSIISCLRTQHYINHSESRVPPKSNGSGFTTVFPIKTMFFSRALTFIKPIVCCLLYPIKNWLSMISYIGYYKWFVMSY